MRILGVTGFEKAWRVYYWRIWKRPKGSRASRAESRHAHFYRRQPSHLPLPLPQLCKPAGFWASASIVSSISKMKHLLERAKIHIKDGFRKGSDESQRTQTPTIAPGPSAFTVQVCWNRLPNRKHPRYHHLHSGCQVLISQVGLCAVPIPRRASSPYRERSFKNNSWRRCDHERAPAAKHTWYHAVDC